MLLTSSFISAAVVVGLEAVVYEGLENVGTIPVCASIFGESNASFSFVLLLNTCPRMRRLPCGCYFIALHSNPFFSRPCAYNRLFSI